MSYEIGQKVRVNLEVRDAETDVLTNATVVVSLLKPNLTVGTAPTVVNDGVGLYHFDVVPDAVPGPWQWTATISGAVVAVQRGQFWIRDPAMNLIGIEEIKTHLNKDLGVHTDDEELRDWIEAGRWVIEREVGPVLPRTITETFDAIGRRKFFLTAGPVMSVSLVRETRGPGDVVTLTPEDGVTYSENQYLFHTTTRAINRRNSGWDAYFWGDVAVTWMVGRYPIPMNYKLALAELIAHLWRASQLASGGTRPNVNNPDVVQLGYAVPNRVRELLGRRRAPRLGG